MACEFSTRYTIDRAETGAGVGCGATASWGDSGKALDGGDGCGDCARDQMGLATIPQINNVTTARTTRLHYIHLHANPKRN
jgi:hypothetical protein